MSERSCRAISFALACGTRHLVEQLGLVPGEVLRSKTAQGELLGKVLEPVVDRQAVARWLVEVTRDGTNRNAPRDLITVLSRARESQLGAYEMGEDAPSGDVLIGAFALSAGAAVASEMRLKQTLYAEYPDARYSLEPFRGREPWCTLEALQGLWGVSALKAKKRAEVLVWLGALQPPSKETRNRYGVARVYWPALEISY